MPLYFPEGNGSLRLDILAQKYMKHQTFTMSIHVYKKGKLLEEYQTGIWIEIFEQIASWYDRAGTKPEVTTNGKT